MFEARMARERKMARYSSSEATSAPSTNERSFDKRNCTRIGLQITDFNDDCLLGIFFLLPPRDRVRAKRVCQRWNKLVEVTGRRERELATTSKAPGQFPKGAKMTQSGDSLSARPNIWQSLSGERLFILPINVITEHNMRWVISGMVTYRSAIVRCNWDNANGRFFHVDIADASGEIRCVAFKDECEKFHHIFQEGIELVMTKGIIRLSDRRYNSLKHDYQIVIGKNTLVYIREPSLRCPMNHSVDKLSTGCHLLDKFLEGGIKRSGVTQVCGASGTGKSQLALQMCFSAQIMNGRNARGVVYVCTVTQFPFARLKQLLEYSPILNNHRISCENIHVEHVDDTADLMDFLFGPVRLLGLIRKRSLNLLIVDDIATTFLLDFGPRDMRARGKILVELGVRLHKLASVHGLAVVCLNQVSTVIDDSIRDDVFLREQPCLRKIWKCMVNETLHLHRERDRRYLTLRLSSDRSQNPTIEYAIRNCGFVAIDQIPANNDKLM